MLEEIKKTAAFIRSATGDFAPEVGIVLGTGLGDFADRIETRHALDYKDIPGLPRLDGRGAQGTSDFRRGGRPPRRGPCRDGSTTMKAIRWSR